MSRVFHKSHRGLPLFLFLIVLHGIEHASRKADMRKLITYMGGFRLSYLALKQNKQEVRDGAAQKPPESSSGLSSREAVARHPDGPTNMEYIKHYITALNSHLSTVWGSNLQHASMPVN